MRLPLVPPSRLSPEQKALYDRNRQQIAHGFTAFKTADDDGALLGPWGVFIQEPTVGQAHYDLIDAVTKLGRLSAAAKQVAIIVVGARFKAAYELYAHAATAEKHHLCEALHGTRPAETALRDDGRRVDLMGLRLA